MRHTTLHLILAAGIALPLLAAEGQNSPPRQAAAEDPAKKAVEEFKARIKDAKTVHEKALAIQALAEMEPKESSMVPSIARFLAPSPSDISYILPATAADALGRFRGVASASQSLMNALPGYKRIPYVSQRILAAIGRVGHESALPFFEADLTGKDPDAAVLAVRAIAEFPPIIALETLFREADRVEKKLPTASEELKKVYDKVQPELMKAIKRISGQPWTTMKEMHIWWQRSGKAWKEEVARKEAEKKAAPPAPVTPRTTLPPVLLVELLFRENAGQTTANSGASSGMYPAATVTAAKPAWTATVPPNGGPSGLQWERDSGPHAVDLGAGAGLEHLKGLKSFTITGWLLLNDAREGPAGKEAGAGSRVVSWVNPGKVNDGVELVFRGDGSLQLGVNQWADASSARSFAAQIMEADPKATDRAAANNAAWRFFAVTYDSSLAADHVKFYIGTRNADAGLVNAADCNRGPTGPKMASHLTIGNVAPQVRPIAVERAFRGVIDEVRIFGSTADGTGALSPPDIIKAQHREVPVQ